MKELIIEDGIHFVDLQRLIFARRGKACPVFGLDSLAGRLRAGRFFKARPALLPVSAPVAEQSTLWGYAAAVRRSWLLPFSGALSPFFRRIARTVWRSEIEVIRGELLAVIFMAVLAVAFIAALLADVR